MSKNYQHKKKNNKHADKKRRDHVIRVFSKYSVDHSRYVMALLFGSEVDLILKYPNAITMASAAQTIAVRFNPNGVYSFDPTLGSTATPGLTVLSLLFYYYRVTQFKYSFRCVNLSAFPVSVYILNSNTDPGVGGTQGYLQSSNPLSQKTLLAPAGGSGIEHTFTKTLKVSEVVGSISVETDDHFAALVNANPVNVVWTSIMLDSHVPANHPTVFVEVTIWVDVRFYERRELVTLNRHLAYLNSVDPPCEFGKTKIDGPTPFF